MKGATAKAISEVGDPPCDSGCPHVERCATKQIACRRFFMYVDNPLSQRFSKWDGSPPGKCWYILSFPTQDRPMRKKQKIRKDSREVHSG